MYNRIRLGSSALLKSVNLYLRLLIVFIAILGILNKNELTAQCSNITYTCITPSSQNSQDGSVSFDFSNVPGGAWKRIFAQSSCTGQWQLVQDWTNENPVVISNLSGCVYNFDISVDNANGQSICSPYRVSLDFSEANTYSNSPVCEGERLLLNAFIPGMETGTSFEWTGPNGFSATGMNVSRGGVSSMDAGTYTVTITPICRPSYTKTVEVSIQSNCVEECQEEEYVYVNDFINNIVHKFEVAAGGNLVEVGEPWNAYNGDQIFSPHGVAIDANGFIYISEYGKGNTVKLNVDGDIVNANVKPVDGLNHAIVGDFLYVVKGNFLEVWNLCDNSTTWVGYVQLQVNAPFGSESWGLTYNKNDGMLYATDNASFVAGFI